MTFFQKNDFSNGKQQEQSERVRREEFVRPEHTTIYLFGRKVKYAVFASILSFSFMQSLCNKIEYLSNTLIIFLWMCSLF